MRQTTFLTACCLSLAVTTAHARDYKVGSLNITDPWSRTTPKGATVGAGYMKITNTGTTPDRLIGGSFDVASKFEIHEMTMEHDSAGRALHWAQFCGLAFGKKEGGIADHCPDQLAHRRAELPMNQRIPRPRPMRR